MCAFRLANPGLPAEVPVWHAFDSDNDSDKTVEDEHHVNLDCPGHVYTNEQFQDLLHSHISTVC